MNDWQAFKIFLGVCLAISIISLGIFSWLVYANLTELSYIIGWFLSILSTGYFVFANTYANK